MQLIFEGYVTVILRSMQLYFEGCIADEQFSIIFKQIYSKLHENFPSLSRNCLHFTQNLPLEHFFILIDFSKIRISIIKFSVNIFDNLQYSINQNQFISLEPLTSNILNHVIYIYQCFHSSYQYNFQFFHNFCIVLQTFFYDSIFYSSTTFFLLSLEEISFYKHDEEKIEIVDKFRNRIMLVLCLAKLLFFLFCLE